MNIPINPEHIQAKMLDSLYMLNPDHTTTKATNLEQWVHQLGFTDRIVACDKVGNYEISTVFLGLDYSFNRPGPPVLFETAVFGDGGSVQIRGRYHTWEQAAEGHKTIVGVYKAAG